jgi:RNAse (barnase) inhibitor barstar
MTEIQLDASNWRDREDFYDALLPALGAPEWHGRNLDALNDTIGGDGINAVHLPYRIAIVGLNAAPEELLIYLAKFASLIADLRKNGTAVEFSSDHR